MVKVIIVVSRRIGIRPLPVKFIVRNISVNGRGRRQLLLSINDRRGSRSSRGCDKFRSDVHINLKKFRPSRSAVGTLPGDINPSEREGGRREI